ncbi:hypothetical protein Ga0080559_TMP2250 [Salipiger profundus]|uniref:Uncharacterized protein n=1 Tax=Salipiger profundus TaxID=1229727 RepID=A0A1U7D4P5_9RHOB|nr:hypothetical protein Ga0080559_TMP2250 [Salipiger profundus]
MLGSHICLTFQIDAPRWGGVSRRRTYARSADKASAVFREAAASRSTRANHPLWRYAPDRCARNAAIGGYCILKSDS